MLESHSLDFEDSQGNKKNTYADYHLIAKGKPSINPPEVQTEYVEILGRNGLLDMTGGVDGKVYFKNMEAEWNFIVDPRFDYYEVFHTLLQELHGQKFEITLTEDSTFVYTGRLSISQPVLGEHFNEIAISASLLPIFKKKRNMIPVDANKIIQNGTSSYEEGVDTYIAKVDRSVNNAGTIDFKAYVPIPTKGNPNGSNPNLDMFISKDTRNIDTIKWFNTYANGWYGNKNYLATIEILLDREEESLFAGYDTLIYTITGIKPENENKNSTFVYYAYLLNGLVRLTIRRTY